MSRSIFKGTLGNGDQERGARHKPADTKSTEAAVKALSEEYITSANASPDADEDTPILWWLYGTIAEAFAARIPDDADGQQVLDGVVNALRRDCPQEIVNGLNTIYVARVVQALYLAGHNNLLLDLTEPINSVEEFSYLHGTADDKLVLHVQGDFDSFKMIRNCRITHSGKVGEIDYCTDSRFDIHGTECPLVEASVRDCTFYFHHMDRESIRLKEQSLHNTYFVKDNKGEWERVEFEGQG